MTQKKTLKLPKLIGHRGVKDLCPENTLESIARAFEIGLNFVEIDVKISKDRVPILLHDDTLDRTTNGSGLAIDYDYENIKQLDAGKFFYKENTNIFVPKLEDILSLCTNNNGNLNIELKPNKKFEKENVYQIYKITKNINQIDIFFVPRGIHYTPTGDNPHAACPSTRETALPQPDRYLPSQTVTSPTAHLGQQLPQPSRISRDSFRRENFPNQTKKLPQPSR